MKIAPGLCFQYALRARDERDQFYL